MATIAQLSSIERLLAVAALRGLISVRDEALRQADAKQDVIDLTIVGLDLLFGALLGGIARAYLQGLRSTGARLTRPAARDANAAARRRARDIARLIQETTQAQIDASVRRGLSVREAVEQSHPLWSTTRAIRIGVSSATSSVGEGAVIGIAQQPGAKKRWVTAKDERVRVEHRALDGVTLDVAEEFQIGLHSALYPGGFGVARLDINCRCRIEQFRG